MAAKNSKRRWSGKVTRESNALDLARDVFTWDSARRIATSLKKSAERSNRRKADPFRSAMSMLVFYINRAGKSLAAGRRAVLERAKEELRTQFGKRGSGKATARRKSQAKRAASMPATAARKKRAASGKRTAKAAHRVAPRRPGAGAARTPKTTGRSPKPARPAN